MNTAGHGAADYAGRSKYDPARAARYRDRSTTRRARENSVLEGILEDLVPSPVTAVLDAPCGTARAHEVLAPRVLRYVGADLSAAMLAEARATIAESRAASPPADPPSVPAGLVRADLERLPFADRAFELVVTLRFLHHLPGASLERALAELARVCGRFLVLTHFHPLSAHAFERRLRVWWQGRASDRHGQRIEELEAILRPHGLERRSRHGTGFLRELRFAVFERRAGERT